MWKDFLHLGAMGKGLGLALVVDEGLDHVGVVDEEFGFFGV